MTSVYSIPAAPCGRFASQLERQWSWWFAARCWPVQYVGDHLPWGDFILKPATAEPMYLEVKPEGEKFVPDAVARFPADEVPALIILFQAGFNWCEIHVATWPDLIGLLGQLSLIPLAGLIREDTDNGEETPAYLPTGPVVPYSSRRSRR